MSEIIIDEDAGFKASDRLILDTLEIFRIDENWALKNALTLPSANTPSRTSYREFGDSRHIHRDFGVHHDL